MGTKIVVNNTNRVKKASIAEVAPRRGDTKTGTATNLDMILDIMDSAYAIPRLMGSGTVISRNTIGPGFDIVRTPNDNTGTDQERKALLDFFSYSPRLIRNYRDTFGTLSKLYTTVFMFKLFGMAAWELIRDPSGMPIGFDLIPGIVKPNVDEVGNFQVPAYYQYLKGGSTTIKVEIENPNDIVFFSIPDFSSGLFLSEALSLSSFTLPSEIYSASAFLSLHENRSAPYMGFWYTPENVDDDTFDAFVAMVNARYKGSANYGRSPIIMRGKGGFEYLGTPKEDAPYKEGREISKREISSVTGVPQVKYGDYDNVNTYGLREMRRDFYESVLMPMTSLIEEGIYRQLFVREFGITGWRFIFGRPDFTTAIEDASIAMRRIQWGEWSPNDARVSRGEARRDGGDYYLIPLNMSPVDQAGHPILPDMDNGGELEPSEEDPIPDAEPPIQAPPVQIIEELRRWREFSIRVLKGRRPNRKFATRYVPDTIARYVSISLEDPDITVEKVGAIFDMAKWMAGNIGSIDDNR